MAEKNYEFVVQLNMLIETWKEYISRMEVLGVDCTFPRGQLSGMIRVRDMYTAGLESVDSVDSVDLVELED